MQNQFDLEIWLLEQELNEAQQETDCAILKFTQPQTKELTQ